MIRFDDDEMLMRARRAYYRSGGYDIPAGGGEVLWLKKVPYIVLSNVRGILRVFAITATTAGPRLKTLATWPKALERLV